MCQYDRKTEVDTVWSVIYDIKNSEIHRVEGNPKRKIFKNIANIMTGSRVAFSLLLLFIPLSSAWFYILYLVCGLTDMIDGAIARKTGAVSKFGARLDTVADFAFMLVCSIKILPLMHFPVWLWGWMIIVALFFLPLWLTFVETTYSVATVCVLATIAVMQEVYYSVIGKEVL